MDIQPAVARPRTQGGSWGLERSKELQPEEERLGWLWEEARKDEDEGLLRCTRKDQQWCCWWKEQVLPQHLSLGERLPLLLHSTVVWLTYNFITHHHSPSLHPHSIPCKNLSLFFPLGPKQAWMGKDNHYIDGVELCAGSVSWVQQ